MAPIGDLFNGSIVRETESSAKMASRTILNCNSDVWQNEFDAVAYDKLEDGSVDISEYDSSSGNSEMAGAVSADVGDADKSQPEGTSSRYQRSSS